MHTGCVSNQERLDQETFFTSPKHQYLAQICIRVMQNTESQTDENWWETESQIQQKNDVSDALRVARRMGGLMFSVISLQWLGIFHKSILAF